MDIEQNCPKMTSMLYYQGKWENQWLSFKRNLNTIMTKSDWDYRGLAAECYDLWFGEELLLMQRKSMQVLLHGCMALPKPPGVLHPLLHILAVARMPHLSLVTPRVQSKYSHAPFSHSVRSTPPPTLSCITTYSGPY
jgi:hypothetical protein